MGSKAETWRGIFEETRVPVSEIDIPGTSGYFNRFSVKADSVNKKEKVGTVSVGDVARCIIIIMNYNFS